MIYIYLIMLSFALPIFSMSDDVERMRILKKMNAAKNKEKKIAPYLTLPEPTSSEKSTIALTEQVTRGNAWEIEIDREKFIEAVKKNEYKPIQNARPEHLITTFDAEGNNLMQILLKNETKPNSYLVKRLIPLIPLSQWAHCNKNNQSALDMLDLNSKKHAKTASFIIDILYEYIMRRPNVSKYEDVTKTCGYSMLPLIDPKNKNNIRVPMQEEIAKESKKKLSETKLKIIKSYIEDCVEGRR